MPKKKLGEAKALTIIQEGGRPAVVRFIRTATDRYTSGGEKELRAWIAVALDELEREDRAEIFAMLLGAVFDTSKKG